MKQQYLNKNFKADTLAMIEHADAILREYTAQGLVVTVRQLYYQFVSRDLLPNTQQNYKRLADVVSEARMAGLLDWDAIEDRGRVPVVPSQWASADEIVDVAMRSFRMDRLRGQASYAELWVEKQALAGVLEPLAYERHSPLMVNKGYSSQSAMRESALRYARRCRELSKYNGNARVKPVLLYLGDHDPSGEDMVRDIRERMQLFGVPDITVEKIALTMAQIKEHKPPPNPAKSTDPRFKAYRELHGDESWEVDALNPATLQRLVRAAFDRVYSSLPVAAVRKEEDRQRAEMTAAIKRVRQEGKS